MCLTICLVHVSSYVEVVVQVRCVYWCNCCSVALICEIRHAGLVNVRYVYCRYTLVCVECCLSMHLYRVCCITEIVRGPSAGAL